MANESPTWRFPMDNIVTIQWEREPDYNDIVQLEQYLRVAKDLRRPSLHKQIQDAFDRKGK